MIFYCNKDFLSVSNDDSGQMMLVLPIDDIDLYKKRDRLIVKVWESYLKFYFENKIDSFSLVYSIIMIFFKKKRKIYQILNMYYIIGDLYVFIQIKKMKNLLLLVIMIEKLIAQ
jgi:hypothetical protein